jgi:hypothetical protein
MVVLHHLVSVFAPLLSGGNATDLFLDDHVQVLLLLLRLVKFIRIRFKSDLAYLR